MNEAEANRVQTEWCRAEVQRIQAAGERYLNGRLLDEWTAIELRAAQRRITASAMEIRASPSTLAPHDDRALVRFGQHPESIKTRILMLLKDHQPRTADDIGSSVGCNADGVRTRILRLRRDGWRIDALDNPGGQSYYRLIRTEHDPVVKRRYSQYRALLADAQEHDQDELLQLGTRGDLTVWLTRMRQRGMNIVRITHPDDRISYQWRP